MPYRLPRMVTAVQSRFRTTVGMRFSRFAVAAAAALIASQTTLAICLGPVRWTAGRSALAAWVAGAGTSYLLSRWAWERKGRPDLLKETLPFWIVAVCTAIVLTSTTKFANQRGISMGLSHTQLVLFDGAAFFAHAERHLPPYAMPAFVRLVGVVDVTGTLKQRKQRLVAEGFDPALVSDALFVRDDDARRYVPLTDRDLAAVREGRLRL